MKQCSTSFVDHGFRLALMALAIFAFFFTQSARAEDKFISLCYHNVEDQDPDQRLEGVSTDNLIQQLEWLHSEGFKAVSIDDLLAAKEGRRPLPDKAVFLTFDDGYESFYTRVYPILKAYHFPAVIGLVDEWMVEKPKGIQAGDKVNYGGESVPRSNFLTWAQVREMQKSGLVEVASHSHALHSGTDANPQSNTEPKAVTAIYDEKGKAYETAEAYIRRITADAEASARTIKKETGKRPRSMIWPYGAYNQIGISIERKAGMQLTMSLDDGFASVKQLMSINRFLMNQDPGIPDFAVYMRQFAKQQPIRAVQVDLDYVYDPDPAQQERNLDQLVQHIYNLNINAVFLQAFADPDGSGLAKALYFPNRYLPMRADLFNRVAWQLNTRARVKVYAWLPVLSFDLGDGTTPVAAWSEGGQIQPDAKAYRRISPFDPEGRKRIFGIYEDMARLAPIEGLLFHDDAMMSDFEDASAPALAAYRKAGLPDNIKAIRNDPDSMKRWTEFKTQALINFTNELTRHVRLYREPIKTVRNIYASLMLDPKSEEWFAQNYSRFLDAYDYTAVEAMPDMENIPHEHQDLWMGYLMSVAAGKRDGLKKTIFELQTVDWRKNADDVDRNISSEKLLHEMRLLQSKGAMNIAYYPDDFLNNMPDEKALHTEFSLQSYPYKP